MAGKAPQKAAVTIDVQAIDNECFGVRVVGTTPIIYNTMSEKARMDLLFPPDKKEKDRRKAMGILKHDPMTEYRGSIYRFRGDDHPTRILFPAGGAKASIMSAATDLPDVAKAQIGRLLKVVETDIPVWGVPELLMSVVKQSGMNGAPDIRTRAILREWCAEFSVSYTVPNLTKGSVANLLAAAGTIVGWGDYRPQKGKGNFGQYRLTTSARDAEFNRIQKHQGREAQDAALLNPAFFDMESEELFRWFIKETTRREAKGVTQHPTLELGEAA